jgi:predicted SprT family Zn-dependent metalloprotease
MMRDTPLPSGNDRIAVASWALAVMRSFGLDGWQFQFNGRKTAMGLCRHQHRTIALSTHMIERNPPEEIRETLLHEIAHALVGPQHGHDAVWKAKALEVGAQPERCGWGEMPEGRWRALCNSCGDRFYRHRRPRWLTGWFCCGCGRERGKLVWQYV